MALTVPVPWVRVWLSTLLPFCPFPPCIYMLSFADGALPSVDSSPYTISLTCPSANTRIRSNTVWPRIIIRQWDCSRRRRIIDVAPYRAPRLGGILTLGSLQSPALHVLLTVLAILSAHPVHDCETSCFAKLICLAKLSASCRSFCFSFERPSVGAQTFRHSGFPTLLPLSLNGVLRGRRIAFC